jgi:hypothetical protein
MRNRLKFEIFRSPFSSWETLFERAAAFATSVGRDRVVSISHSSDDVDGVVTVWYWDEAEETNLLGLRENE